ncbi:MAG: hypothetical protein ABR583_03250 [Gaiellaceae bacterium]
MPKRFRTVLALLLAAAALPAPAGAGLTVGVTDDAGRDSDDGGAAFLATLAGLGLRENRVSIPWDPDHPTVIPQRDRLHRYVARATARGVRIVFAVYPGRATALTGSDAGIPQFAAFLQELARAYPLVRHYIVGNEPNQPRFWRPQFDDSRAPVGCSSYAPVLAASYDALKAVDSALEVAGLGLSPRGNDDPLSPDNPSTSPVRCLRDLGAVYRASGRTKPLMDELAFHAYPERDTHPLGIGYSWPKAGLTNLDRIKQAVWDAFNGTAQPTFAETGVSVVVKTLGLRIAEVGWQVGTLESARGAYTGTENVPTTDEELQAENYADAVRLAACDPSIESLLFFGLADERDLARWQAGLLRADGTPRPSFDAVKAAVAETAAGCTSTAIEWRHTTRVVGTATRFAGARRILPAGQTRWSFSLGAKEDARFTAGLFRLPRAPAAPQWARVIGRALAGSAELRPVLKVSGRVRAPWGRVVTLPQRRVKPGYYVYGARLAADMNPARVSVVTSQPFRVGKIDRKGKPQIRKPKRPH